MFGILAVCLVGPKYVISVSMVFLMNWSNIGAKQSSRYTSWLTALPLRLVNGSEIPRGEIAIQTSLFSSNLEVLLNLMAGAKSVFFE